MTASLNYDTMSTTSSQQLFTKCCCCIPLKIGCFILGYVSLFINIFHAMDLLALTTYMGLYTHAFEHFDLERPRVINDQLPEVQSIERPYLNQIGILLIVVLFANVAWLVLNVACLIGLHKKRPGPIRVYVAFASARLLLSLAAFVYFIMVASANLQNVVCHSFELGLAAYFILVYYIYAVQLERELQENQQTQPDPAVNDVAFIYPTKMDKQILVA